MIWYFLLLLNSLTKKCSFICKANSIPVVAVHVYYILSFSERVYWLNFSKPSLEVIVPRKFWLALIHSRSSEFRGSLLSSLRICLKSRTFQLWMTYMHRLVVWHVLAGVCYITRLHKCLFFFERRWQKVSTAYKLEF